MFRSKSKKTADAILEIFESIVKIKKQIQLEIPHKTLRPTLV